MRIQMLACGCRRRFVWQPPMDGLSFDIELLYLARKRGYRIVELPIPWYFRAESKVNLFQDTLQNGAGYFDDPSQRSKRLSIAVMS